MALSGKGAMRSGEGFLSGIKSKLGFADRRQEDAYGEYDEYDDYEVDGEYEADYAGYEEYAPEGGGERAGSPRSSEPSGYAPRRAGSSDADRFHTGSFTSTTVRDRARRDNSEEGPRLVSLEDVRATTPYPNIHEEEQGEAAAARRGASPTLSARGRAVLDSSLPLSMTPEGTEAMSARANQVYNANQQGHGGLNALFGNSGTSGASVARRSLYVIEPKSYEEMDQMAPALERGQIVILDTRKTGADLSRRLLDFSFGVASALSASVDCVASGVFAVCTGSALNDEERSSLKSRGII